MFADPRVAFLAPTTRLGWATPRRNYSQSPGDPLAVQLAFLKQFTQALVQAGVPILAGTDTPLIPGLLPGSGLIEELRLLEEAGLSRYEALASATRTPGEFLARFVRSAQPVGTVTAGARADLVLVATSPLQSLDTLRNPLGVMVGGRWRTAAELTSTLEQNRRALEPILMDAFGQ